MHPAIIIGTVRSLIVDVAMGQIPRSTERISSFYYSRISSRLKWYKNYRNRLRLAKVIVKNKMSRFFVVHCVYSPNFIVCSHCSSVLTLYSSLASPRFSSSSPHYQLSLSIQFCCLLLFLFFSGCLTTSPKYRSSLVFMLDNSFLDSWYSGFFENPVICFSRWPWHQ